MTYKVIEYQEKCVDELLKKIKDGDKKYMLLAPTGSGKTVIMSKFLERFVNKHSNYAFIWASPRKNLPLQSRDKMESSSIIDCVLTDTVTSNRRIGKNQVWFVNWEKMFRNLQKDTERGNSLVDIIKNTRDDGFNIMLLVDEAHWGAQRSGTQVRYAIDNVINADIIVYITATPKQGLDDDHTVNIELKDVQREEMVVAEIPLNYDLKEDDVTMEVDEKLLDMACQRRAVLKRHYEDEGSDVNPLLMVQIPNSNDGEIKRKVVEKVMAKYGMTEDCGNFVSLEEKRRDDEYVRSISDNDNKIDAVIFKQNVSLGWDCPRAKILVGLRDTKEETFRLQTLGRIMRMPEQRYYKNEELNMGYFYSQGKDFDYSEDTIRSILRGTVKTKIKPGISMTDLPAVRIRMMNPQEELDTEEFKHAFRKNAKERKTVEKMRPTEFETAMLHTSRDITVQSVGRGRYMALKNELDMQKDFELKLVGILNDDKIECRGLFSIEFMKNLFKEAIYEMFVDAGKNVLEDRIYYQLVDEYNLERIRHPIIVTINGYEKIMREIIQKGVDEFMWNVPKSQLLSECNEDTQGGNAHPGCVMDYGSQFEKYAMSPTYLEIASKLELNFCRSLDRSNNVNWWYKNGTGRGDFAIIYHDRCRPRRFMPDFIVGMNDGKVGIFDTKSGDVLEEAGKKSRALYDYMMGYSELNLFGGIVTRRGDGWIVNDGSEFTSNLGHVSWKNLRL